MQLQQHACTPMGRWPDAGVGSRIRRVLQGGAIEDGARFCRGQGAHQHASAHAGVAWPCRRRAPVARCVVRVVRVLPGGGEVQQPEPSRAGRAGFGQRQQVVQHGAGWGRRKAQCAQEQSAHAKHAARGGHRAKAGSGMVVQQACHVLPASKGCGGESAGVSMAAPYCAKLRCKAMGRGMEPAGHTGEIACAAAGGRGLPKGGRTQSWRVFSGRPVSG